MAVKSRPTTGQWFISLLDAKQPLSFWVDALLRKALPELDPLLGARLISVLAGVASTALLFAVGRRLAGPTAGLLAAIFYAVLPYGVFYDRLAYTDAIVNCFGLLVVWGALATFQTARPSLIPAVLTGLALGLGFFAKATVALFAVVPAGVALLWHGRRPRAAAGPLMIVYGLAAVFPVISLLALPAAPTLKVNNLFLHHISFFTPPSLLLADPTVNIARNMGARGTYLDHYVTLSFTGLALAALLSLAWRRRREAWLAVPLLAVPWLVQILVLEYFPIRYRFPHVWPLALFMAIALSDAAPRWSLSTRVIVGAVTIVPLAQASMQLLEQPDGWAIDDPDRPHLGDAGGRDPCVSQRATWHPGARGMVAAARRRSAHPADARSR